MTNRFPYRTTGRLAAAAALLTSFSAMSATLPAARIMQVAHEAQRQSAPNAQVVTATISELGDAFWKWQFSLPVNANPIFGQGDCKTGQPSSQLLFLGGTSASFDQITEGNTVTGTADRTCVLSQTRTIFFPVVNSECSDVPGDQLDPNLTTESNLRACAKFFTDHTAVAWATLDGTPLAVTRAASPEGGYIFGPLPGNNVLQSFGLAAHPGSTHVSVSDGYYVKIDSVSPGEHTLRFYGVLDLTSAFPGGMKFIQDITYHLKVTP